VDAFELTAKEIVDAVLSGFALLVSWPIVALVVFWVIRNQLIELIPALAERVRKISVGNASIELAAAAESLAASPEIGPELMSRLLLRLRELGTSSDEADEPDVISSEELLPGDIDEDSGIEDSEASRAEIQELTQTLEELDKDE